MMIMDAEAQANSGEAMREGLETEKRLAEAPLDRASDALDRASKVVSEIADAVRETPEQAYMRKIQEAPRTPVDVTRMEVCTGMVWLADGSRISFKIAVPPVISRAEGVLDANGMPVYDLPWQLQVHVRPPRK